MVCKHASRLALGLLVSVAVTAGGFAASAAASTDPTADAAAIADAVIASDDAANLSGAEFTTRPPSGGPTATSNDELALFPLKGPRYGILSTGDATATDSPNDSPSKSTDNGGGGGGHGAVVNDLVTLRIDLNVPSNRNCLTVDYRFLSEEFPEYVGSEYNDSFLAELDSNDFSVAGSGSVSAPSNFAFGPDGNLTTVNSAGTSADNALGTTFDGATPILRATTPITPGSHSVYLSIYDASDRIYDSTVFVDNVNLRNVTAPNCKRGAAPNGEEDRTCMGKAPSVIASGGVATGTKGKDVILGSGSDDVIRGRGGDDIICGRGGDDEIRGNGGDDKIDGNAGDDAIFGNVGDDLINGKRDRDELHGQSGDDRINGGGNDDRMFGGNGDDRMAGNQGNDAVRGRRGNDRLHGNMGDDVVGGGQGNDRCRGGTGSDRKVGCEANR